MDSVLLNSQRILAAGILWVVSQHKEPPLFGQRSLRIDLQPENTGIELILRCNKVCSPKHLDFFVHISTFRQILRSSIVRSILEGFKRYDQKTIMRFIVLIIPLSYFRSYLT